ncbi:hypothetical protein KBD61_00335 [Patescibacteria group bacterium]|nr:hypothetical protein [Patescibacteria group bacterium]MBP9709456.1 hypothetical protein [Patescibacteria group bacterium]
MLQRRLPWMCDDIYQEDYEVRAARASYPEALSLFTHGLRDAFHQGCEAGELITLLAVSWSDARRATFDVTRFVLSQFHPACTQYRQWKLRSTFNAACLQGALLTIHEQVTRYKRLLDPTSNLFLNRQYHILRMSMQHQLTRAWMHLPRFLRQMVEYRWYENEPYANSMLRWQERCRGSARVSTTALGILTIPGDWRGFVSSPKQDEEKLDLIMEGQATIQGETRKVRLLIQAKGSYGKGSSAHLITHTKNPVPGIIPAEEWESLMSLWRLEEFQGRDMPSFPVLVNVATPKDTSPYHFELTVPEVAAAIREAFQG